MVFNHRLTLAQVYSLVGICSLPIFYLVGAGAALFWVLGKRRKCRAIEKFVET